MPRRDSFLTAVVLLAAVMVGEVMASGAEGGIESERALATSYPETVPSPSWSELRFSASKLFFRSSTEIRLVVVEPERLGDELREPSGGEPGLRPAGSPVARMVVSSRFGSRHDESSLWFELDSSRALQRLKVRHGSKAYQKTYRFSATGVHSHRIAPEEGEGHHPPEHWSKIEDHFFEHGAADCAVVIEPTALLYLLAENPPAQGELLELCAFSDKTTHRIVAEHAGHEMIAVDYRAFVPGNERPVHHRGEQRLLRIEVRPAGEEGELELLGLEGAVKVYVDERQRLPIRVVGRVAILGRVSVELESVRLTASESGPPEGTGTIRESSTAPKFAASPRRR